jgi:hypothetical protein
VAPGQPTTVVVTALKVDAENDPAGLDRRLAFRSQGAGKITVDLHALSPQGAVVMCLSADGARIGCKTTNNGKLTATTTKKRVDFVVTLRGASIDTPIVEVTITFPARTPSLKISNARFDGTAYPDFNGLQAFVTPRADGQVKIDASWGGHPLLYEIDLMEQGGPGAQVLANQGPATGVTQSLAVTAGNPWKLNLQNIEEGFGVTGLDATIAWP